MCTVEWWIISTIFRVTTNGIWVHEIPAEAIYMLRGLWVIWQTHGSFLTKLDLGDSFPASKKFFVGVILMSYEGHGVLNHWWHGRFYNKWCVTHYDSYDSIVESSTWWRHQMETFPGLLAFCAGNSPVTGEFPAQRPVMRSFYICFDLRLNKQLSEQSWSWWFDTPSRPLWRHNNVTA